MNYAAYWDRGVENVPVMTGAASVMGCDDLLEPLSMLSAFPLQGTVLDVGCGTGRLSQLCVGVYIGADISKDALEYARRVFGVEAHLILGADDLGGIVAGRAVDVVTCLSVFTHIPATERLRYLLAFRDLAPELLVDIIPGNGQGDVRLWTADPAEFERALNATGWCVLGKVWRTSPDGITHLYYHGKRREP